MSQRDEAPVGGGLRALRHVYTANDPQSRQAIFTKARAGAPKLYSQGELAVDDIYGAPTLTDPLLETDVHLAHPEEAGGRALGAGAASPGGTVCRVVDFAPRHECATRRGENVDYAVVIEGTIVLTLASGQETRLERGDVAVQRATSHVWRNASGSEWARMLFVLQDTGSGLSRSKIRR
ncbi:hypothetical protein CDD80_5710 [Ophiocordyceps camponoti-rufipedis]|uniref:Cupin 2 conserved barrel domain-containing protein n=1 Tax=Ophiocordyceps camponoti-rufipedis TaxID=2004952 RepID=A0A2C5YUX3_9HYPO|nr:hypothetical protein CDD80_5710 [Ophiocordyceps camponoti-rufipedis]